MASLSYMLEKLRPESVRLSGLLLWVLAGLAIYVLIPQRKTRFVGGVAATCPPGPRADPVIGHARFIPTQYAWITLSEWAKKFGERVCADMF